MKIRHTIRANGFGKTRIVHINAREAIIENCKECLGWHRGGVQKCTEPLCALYPFRLPGNPQNNVLKPPL